MSNQLLQDVEQPGQEEEKEEEETEIKKVEDEEQKQETDNGREESKGENPLEKYMKMVLEAREKQHAQVRIPGELCFCDWTCSSCLMCNPVFCLRVPEEKKQDIRAQRPRACLRRKTTGN